MIWFQYYHPETGELLRYDNAHDAALGWHHRHVRFGDDIEIEFHGLTTHAIRFLNEIATLADTGTPMTESDHDGWPDKLVALRKAAGDERPRRSLHAPSVETPTAPGRDDDRMQARDLMETEVQTVASDDDVADVFKKFARYDFSGFPVVDGEDRVVGVVTESDLVDLFEPDDETLWIPIGLPPFVDTLTYQVKAPWADLDLGVDMIRNADRPISEVMSTDVATVTPDAAIDDVLDLLAGDDPDINRVPVVDEGGRIVGIIARQDVIRAFRDKRLD